MNTDELIKAYKDLIYELDHRRQTGLKEVQLRSQITSLTDQVGEEKEFPERFKMPLNKELIDIAIIFNDGRLEKEKLTDMIAMCQFVLDRLYENNTVNKKSSRED